MTTYTVTVEAKSKQAFRDALKGLLESYEEGDEPVHLSQQSSRTGIYYEVFVSENHPSNEEEGA